MDFSLPQSPACYKKENLPRFFQGADNLPNSRRRAPRSILYPCSAWYLSKQQHIYYRHRYRKQVYLQGCYINKPLPDIPVCFSNITASPSQLRLYSASAAYSCLFILLITFIPLPRTPAAALSLPVIPAASHTSCRT